MPTERERHGIKGSVKIIRTEVAEWEIKDGTWASGPKWLLKISTYSQDGKLIDEPIYNYGSYFANNVYDDSSPMALGLYFEKKRNNEGQVVESLLFNRKGSLIMRFIYEYDEAGNKTKSLEYRADGTLALEHNYAFDEQGRPTKETLQILEGIECERVWNYDDRGFVIKEIEKCSNNTHEDTNYNYDETDSAGNWTKCSTSTSYFRDGNAVGEGRKTFFRGIEYYE